MPRVLVSRDSVWSQGVCDQHTAECVGILSILTSGVMCSGVHRRHRPAHYHPAVSREVKLSASVKTWRHTVDTADTYSTVIQRDHTIMTDNIR